MTIYQIAAHDARLNLISPQIYLAKEISSHPCLFSRDESLGVVALGQVVGPVHHVEAGEGQREDEPRDHVDTLRLGRHLARPERTEERGLKLNLATGLFGMLKKILR